MKWLKFQQHVQQHVQRCRSCIVEIIGKGRMTAWWTSVLSARQVAQGLVCRTELAWYRLAWLCVFGVCASVFPPRLSIADSADSALQPLPAPIGWPAPDPAPTVPGPIDAPPIDASIGVDNGAPRIYEHTADAGPDQSFLLVGEWLTGKLVVWGRSARSSDGQRWEVKTSLVDSGYVVATLPDRAPDALFLAWVGNDAGWSRPIRLNVPRPWWCWPKYPAAGKVLRIFGRDLARRPDRTTAFVYLNQPGQRGRWLEVTRAGKYTVSVRIPKDIEPGRYRLWFHAGCGGRFGWSEPLELELAAAADDDSPPSTVELPAPRSDQAPVDLNEALQHVAAEGGGVLKLAAGTYFFRGTIRVPGGVILAGAGRDATRLQLVQSEQQEFAGIHQTGWNRAPSGVHTVGDMMEYRIRAPASGTWTVWLRYATEMSPWKLPGVSGQMTLQVDDDEPVLLQNLPNTGSFGTFRWSRSAVVNMPAGEHTLRWQNIQGGGISLDALVLTLDSDWEPSDQAQPESTDRRLIVQGEDVVRFVSRDGSLPSRSNAAVWLAGDGASVRNATISGNTQVNIGIAVRSPEPLTWVRGCRVELCRVSDLEGKSADDISAVRLFRAEGAVVAGNELWGRCPLYLSGVRHCALLNNRLVPVTRYGGNSEAAIQGRNEVIEQCVIEGNMVASPPGAEAGGPQVRRLIWVSTGRGSVTHNWFALNGVERPMGPGAAHGAGPMRFGGVAGTEQNVGEMILFEANHRTMYFGPLVAADHRSVTLPVTLPPTPDNCLGSVAREQLAHDAEGNETPFWPPDHEDDSPEPPITEYYVTVFQGAGWGQTRRVMARQNGRLILDRPWRVPPEAGSLVAVGTAFYQNLIVENDTAEGMTGIQLWISCIENVIASNSIAEMRKPGLFLYANATTLASSMPRRWNRGISPLFFNYVEGNRTEACSAGVLVTSGDSAGLPIKFPRALGNVLRHNSFVASRSDGVIVTSRKGSPEVGDTSPSILGTIVEFNMVRDARCAYHSGAGSDGALFRRNHAYFWDPVSQATEPPVAFRIDRSDGHVAIEANSIEGPSGVPDTKRVIPLMTPQTP